MYIVLCDFTKERRVVCYAANFQTLESIAVVVMANHYFLKRKGKRGYNFDKTNTGYGYLLVVTIQLPW